LKRGRRSPRIVWDPQNKSLGETQKEGQKTVGHRSPKGATAVKARKKDETESKGLKNTKPPGKSERGVSMGYLGGVSQKKALRNGDEVVTEDMEAGQNWDKKPEGKSV